MTAKQKHASSAELRVLDVLWKAGACTVREVAESLHDAPTAVQYRTVQVQLDRLEKKELVSRDRSQSVHRFVARVLRDRFIGGQLKQLADKVCDGSLTPLLINLVQTVDLTEDQKKELWRLLEGR